MKNYNVIYSETKAQIELEARTLWDLVVASTCGCCELHKPCDLLVSDGEYMIEPLPCGYACETEATRKLYLDLIKDNDMLSTMYPIFWKKTAFAREIGWVLERLVAWDPNGDWDLYDVLDTPWQTIEILEGLKEELEYSYEEVPGWIDVAIEYLMLLAN